jgi:hypothetical protein
MALTHRQPAFLQRALLPVPLALAVALGCASMAGCRKPASDAALDSPSLAPKKRVTSPPPAKVLEQSQLTTLAAPSPAVPLLPAPVPVESVQEVTALVAEFDRPGTDEARRLEVISELAINATPLARQSLARIYRTARDIAVKQQVLEALQLIESEDLDPTLLLLQEAVAPGQDAELRLTAVEALRDIVSPKTIRIWQTLLSDRDVEIRNTAKAMIEFLAGESQP